MITVGQLKTRLKRIPHVDDDISGQEERYERLNQKLVDIGSPELTDMPRNPSPDYDHMAEMLYRLEELEKEIKGKRDFLRKERKWVEDILWYMQSATEKKIIRLKYLDKEPWKDIQFILFGGENDFLENDELYARKVYRIHGNALEHMCVIINQKNLW